MDQTAMPSRERGDFAAFTKILETAMHFEHLVLGHEPMIRLGLLAWVFMLVTLGERLSLRRALTLSRALRWSSNLGLVVLNTALLRLLFPRGGGLQRTPPRSGWQSRMRMSVMHVWEMSVAVIDRIVLMRV